MHQKPGSRQSIHRASIECLEERRLLSAYLTGTILHLDGTSGDNTITLSQTTGASPTYNTSVDGTTATFTRKMVTKIIIHGQAGNDKIIVKGYTRYIGVVSIFGDDGNDTIYGSNSRDGIVGGAGNDVIYGRAGNDHIIAGDGNDMVSGGPGRDFIRGDNGNDTLYGDAGNDTIYGRAGNDILGGDSEDILTFVHVPQTTPHLARGNDLLVGGGGNDWLLGGIGNAGIKVDSGRDTMIGGPGADVLDKRGNDIVKDKSTAEGDYVPSEDYTPSTEADGAAHGHIHLTIQVKDKSGNYQSVIIPANIGLFKAGEWATIHTHALDNVVHLEAPAGSTWTLGDFFRNWGISFDSTHVGRYFGTSAKPLTLTIDGVNNVDFANARLPIVENPSIEVAIKIG